uniref:Uncharacterized protein n=1 Tax=Anguilla anguilla TaxID=7936 RepID=A0A0E9Q625_ANGAN
MNVFPRDKRARLFLARKLFRPSASAPFSVLTFRYIHKYS